MKKRTKLAAGAGAAVAAVGAGAAVAATQLSPSAESKAVVEDAAKQLGVDPAKLNDALKQALENRIDEAVEDGALTKEQGDAMKARIEADDFPLLDFPLLGGPVLGGPVFGGHHGVGHHAFGHLEAAATFLGIPEAELREALRQGKTLAQVAKDANKSVDGLVDALVAATTKKLNQAVADGRLTKVQRDEIVSGLEQRTAAFVNGDRQAFREKRGFGFRGGAGPKPRFELPPPAA